MSFRLTLDPRSYPVITEVGENLHQGGLPNGLLPKYAAVINLYGETTYRLQDDTTYLLLELQDRVDAQIDRELMYVLADFVNLMRRRGPVLVHCQAGLNRSGLLCALSLMRGPEELHAHDAIEQLRRKRCVDVLCNPTFADWLRSEAK